MAEVCVRCNLSNPARDYTVTKGAVEFRRTLCEPCREITAETYPVKPAGRQSAASLPEEKKLPAASVPTPASE